MRQFIHRFWVFVGSRCGPPGFGGQAARLPWRVRRITDGTFRLVQDAPLVQMLLVDAAAGPIDAARRPGAAGAVNFADSDLRVCGGG